MGHIETLERADAIERGLLDIGQASKQSGVTVKYELKRKECSKIDRKEEPRPQLLVQPLR